MMLFIIIKFVYINLNYKQYNKYKGTHTYIPEFFRWNYVNFKSKIETENKFNFSL